MRSVTLDIETTGLSFLEGHKIVEIGCVELLNNFPSGKTWQRYINPERTMPEDAFKIHGLSEEFLSSKPVFSEIIDEIVKNKAGIVVHNKKELEEKIIFLKENLSERIKLSKNFSKLCESRKKKSKELINKVFESSND